MIGSKSFNFIFWEGGVSKTSLEITRNNLRLFEDVEVCFTTITVVEIIVTSASTSDRTILAVTVAEMGAMSALTHQSCPDGDSDCLIHHLIQSNGWNWLHGRPHSANTLAGWRAAVVKNKYVLHIILYRLKCIWAIGIVPLSLTLIIKLLSLVRKSTVLVFKFNLNTLLQRI